MRRDLKTDSEREEIVFGRHIDWDGEAAGGTLRFGISSINADLDKPITADTVRRLIDEWYLDPDDRQNYAPSAAEMLEAMEEMNAMLPDGDEVRAIGYMVAPRRNDARITLEGLVYTGENDSKIRDYFNSFAENADERDLRGVLSCWWD